MGKSDRRTLYVMRGLPGSGKTTWATEYMERRNHVGIYRINRDDLRAMLHKGAGHSHEREKIVRKIRDHAVLRLLILEDCDVIVDDTNLREADMDHWSYIANRAKAKLVDVDLRDVPVHVCVERDQKRPNYVGEKVIRDMYTRYVAKITTVYPQPDYSLPFCIIADLDGTLADYGDRSPFDKTGQCINDQPRQWVINVVRLCLAEVGSAAHDPQLIVFSGRFGTEQNMDATRAWLHKYMLPFKELYMRHPDDHRRDSVIKREMFDKYVRNKYYPIAVFDDRPQVCRECWEPLGLGDRLFKVGRIDEEF